MISNRPISWGYILSKGRDIWSEYLQSSSLAKWQFKPKYQRFFWSGMKKILFKENQWQYRLKDLFLQWLVILPLFPDCIKIHHETSCCCWCMVIFLWWHQSHHDIILIKTDPDLWHRWLSSCVIQTITKPTITRNGLASFRQSDQQEKQNAPTEYWRLRAFYCSVSVPVSMNEGMSSHFIKMYEPNDEFHNDLEGDSFLASLPVYFEPFGVAEVEISQRVCNGQNTIKSHEW